MSRFSGEFNIVYRGPPKMAFYPKKVTSHHQKGDDFFPENDNSPRIRRLTSFFVARAVGAFAVNALAGLPILAASTVWPLQCMIIIIV